MGKRVAECEVCGNARCMDDYCWRTGARMVWNRKLTRRIWLDHTNKLIMTLYRKDGTRETGVSPSRLGNVFPKEGQQAEMFSDDENRHRDPTW